MSAGNARSCAEAPQEKIRMREGVHDLYVRLYDNPKGAHHLGLVIELCHLGR